MADADNGFAVLSGRRRSERNYVYKIKDMDIHLCISFLCRVDVGHVVFCRA